MVVDKPMLFIRYSLNTVDAYNYSIVFTGYNQLLTKSDYLRIVYHINVHIIMIKYLQCTYYINYNVFKCKFEIFFLEKET